MLFGVRGFSGLSPALDDRLLEPNQATIAINTRLDNGLLRAWREPIFTKQLGGISAYKTIYRWGQNQPIADDALYWIGFTIPVNISRGPTDDGIRERTYWTDWQASGEVEATRHPKYTYKELVTGWTGDVNSWYRLGVPAPANGLNAAPGARPPLDEEEIFETVAITGLERVPPVAPATVAEYAQVNFTEEQTRFNKNKPAKVSVSDVTPEAYNGTFDITAWADDQSWVRYKAVTVVAGPKTDTLQVTGIHCTAGNDYFELSVGTHSFDTSKKMTVTVPPGANWQDCVGTFTGCTWNTAVTPARLRVYPASSNKGLQFVQSPTQTDCFITRSGDYTAVISFLRPTNFDTTKSAAAEIKSLDRPPFLNSVAGTTYSGAWLSHADLQITLTSLWHSDLYYDFSNNGAEVYVQPTGPTIFNPAIHKRVWDADGNIEYIITGTVKFTVPATNGLTGITSVTVSGDTNNALPETPAPTGASSVTLYGTGFPEDDRIEESRDYVYTYVSPFGEEGSPSPPMGGPITVVDGQPVSLSGFAALTEVGIGKWNVKPGEKSRGEGGAYDVGAVPKIRLYRTANSGTNATFLYVDEKDLDAAIATGYQDTKTAEELGEPLATNDYDPPPFEMQGFCVMANGICAGFHDNQIYFSEPYLPYAWPRDYALKTAYRIVGIQAFGTSLVVGTVGNPYVITGVDPYNMTMSKLETQQSCASARSMVAMDAGVVYASPDGLVVVDGGGAQLVTGGMLTRDQWQAYSPSTMFAVRSENRYFAFYNSAIGSGALVFDFSGTAATMWHFSPSLVSLWPGTAPSNTFSCTAAYNDLERDGMFMANGADMTVYRWDSGTLLLSYVWQSKLFELSAPGNLGCVQAIFDRARDIGGATYSDVFMTVNSYVVKDDAPVATFADTLSTHELRRMQSGFTSRYWQYKMQGKVSVSFAGLASLAAELKYG